MSDFKFQNSKYKVIRKISEGPGSSVLLVESEGKQYALKTLKAKDPEALARFRRESSTLARLNHPNLVKLVDVGEQGDVAYLVMEYLDGESLAARLAKVKTLSETECVSLLGDVTGALGEIHRNNLVHRDIKPLNIFLTASGPRLIDLGLVGDIDEIKSETALVGTPLYCSPEQTKILKRDVRFYSDLYSLGIVFFEALTGGPPFTGSLNDILQQHSSTPIPDLRILKPNLRPSLIAIVEKLLAKDPDDRYSTTEGLLQDLNRLDEIEVLLGQNKDLKLGGKEHSVAARIKYVERTEEIDSIHASWMESKAGQPGLFIVKGASGSGKSRLSNEFLSRALEEEKNQLLVLKCKNQISGKDVPFAGIREAVENLVSYALSESEEFQAEFRKRMLVAGDGREDQLLKFSRGLQKIFKKSTNQTTIEADFEGEKEKFFNSITDFIVKLAGQWKGLIFFVDDLQWLDLSSLQIFERLLSQSSQNVIFVLGTARNDAASAESMKKIEESLAPSIRGQLELGGFSKDQMSGLLSNYLGTAQMDPAIIDFFFSRSNGNPFVAAEYLRVVVDQGFLIFKSNRWQMLSEGIEKLKFSDDVYDLILKRVDGSSPELKSMLSYAAIYGNTFSVSDIARVARISKEKATSSLKEGETLGLLDFSGGDRWKFAHDKIPESLRGGLAPEEQKRISDELSAYFKDKPDLSEEEIFAVARLTAGGHYETNLDYVIQANVRAGFLSSENHAHEQAYHFLKFALSLTQKVQLPREAMLELTSKLAISAAMTSDWKLAESAVRRALDYSQTKDEMITSLHLKIWVMKVRGDITTAWETFRMVCNVAGRPYPSYLLWKILTTLWVFFVTMFLEITNLRLTFLVSPNGKKRRDLSKLADLYFEAQYCSEYRLLLDFILVSLRILLIGQITGRKRELALGYATTGYAFANLGVPYVAMAFLNKGVRLSEESGDEVTRASCLARRGDGAIICGATFDETTEFMKNFELTRRYLNPAEIGRTRNSRALLLILKGRNVESLEFLKSYLNPQNPFAARMAVVSTINALHLYWVNYSILGMSHEAQEAKKIALKESSPYRFVALAQRYVAVYELQVRRYMEEVDELVNDLREHYMGHFSSFTEMGGKLNYSQTVFLDLLELERARNREERLSLRTRAKTNMQRVYFMLFSPLYRMNYYLLKAYYFRIVGNFRRARKWLKICEETAGKTGNLRSLFDVHREYARVYSKMGDEVLAKSRLASALQLAAQYKWKPAETSLIDEFGDMAEELLINWGGLPRASGQTIQASQTSQSAPASVSASKAGQTRQASRVSQGTIQGGATTAGQGEQPRFADALLKVSHAFISSLDMVEQSKSVLTQIVKLFAAERGFVFIKDENKPEFHPMVAKNSNGEDISNMVGYSSTVLKKVMETGEPVVVTSADEAEALGSESSVLYNLRSIIATPLKVKDKILGAVYLDSSLMKGLFAKSDTPLFSTLANHISVAMELSRMAKVELEKAQLRKELEIQAAVALESKKVEVLVDNMQQALFSIDSSGTIVEPVSKYSAQVLGRSVVGQNVAKTLYKDVSDKEALARVDSAIGSVFGEDELQWDLMSDHFPRKINFAGDSDKIPGKILKVQTSPVWDAKAALEKIVFVVEDITALEELERRLKEQGVQSTILGEILESDFEELAEFFSDTAKSIDGHRQHSKNIDEAYFLALLRDLHTLKGNARLFKLSLLSGQIHQSETDLLGFKGNIQDPEKMALAIDSSMSRIVATFTQYQNIFQRVSPSRSGENTSGTSELALERLSTVVGKIEKTLPPEEKNALQWAVSSLSFRSVKEIAEKYSPMVKDISSQLGKKVNFTVTGDALIDGEKVRLLRECLLHLIRNSIDHGLETEEVRVKAGKSGSGQLTIDCREDLSQVSISIRDDGSGIDAERVLKRAIERGIVAADRGPKMSVEDKVNLIFSPNFSTKESVTEISGRGIGLDVVKQNIASLNGELKVTTETGKGSKFLIVFKQGGESVSKISDAS